MQSDLPLLRWGIQASLWGLAEREGEEEGSGELLILAPTGPGQCAEAGERGEATIICLPRGACRETPCPACRVAPLEETGPEKLRRLVREVARGQGFDAAPAPEAGRLTPREREIGRLVSAGLSSAAIGERLFISPRTVEKHRANLMGKLGVTNAAGLARELLFAEAASREPRDASGGPDQLA
jgi:DNA-binding CsgD family transcriptional regulator